MVLVESFEVHIKFSSFGLQDLGKMPFTLELEFL
jgi:hypothetical protein